jgi:mannitol/fructose-specific phosphotransferase system IIA component (Ntr-type)/RNA polymerase-binding transcription factor DksA
LNDTETDSAPHGRTLRLINHMLQTQDLIFARDQQKASMSSARLSQLDAAIEALLNDLPADNRSHFEKMWKKVGLAIVPISKGNCSACGMQIPVSQVHAVHAGEALYLCPSCARYLYYPEAPPRRVATKKRLRSEPVQVGIARFSSPTLMLPRIKATSREDALGQICALMEKEQFVDHADRLLEEALKREVIASTAVDQGLAFPHVRGVEGGGLSLALATLPKGVKFDEGTRNLTRIICFVSIPTAASAFYLRLLAGLTQALRDETTRDALLEAETPETLWKALVKATRLTIT